MGKQLIRIWAASTLALAASTVQAEDTWQYSIKPYGWYVWFDGETGADGEAPVESDSSLFDMLDAFFLIHGEARRGKLSLLAEFNWVELSDTVSGQRGALSADWDLEGYMVALGAGYAVYEEKGTRLEVIGGIRYWDVEVETGLGPVEASGDSTITDPFIGLRIESPVNKKMTFHGMASYAVGGDSDEAIDVGAEVRWPWRDSIDLALGARYTKLDFEDDAVLVDASLYGPYVAINFRF